MVEHQTDVFEVCSLFVKSITVETISLLKKICILISDTNTYS